MTSYHFTDPNLLVDGETANDTDVLTPLRELDAVIQQIAHNLHAGRLSISGSDPLAQSATPVATIYLLPYGGNVSVQQDGSGNWVPYQIPDAGISLDVSALSVDTNYDIFEYASGGAIVLEAVAWASNTARATALTAQDGVYLKSGATTRKYRGTIRTISSTGTKAIDSSESPAKGYVWNFFNRRPRRLRYSDATASWNYTTAAWRASNGNSGAVIELVNGLQEDAFRAMFCNGVSGQTAVMYTGMGYDSLTTPVAAGRAAVEAVIPCQYSLQPGIGYHYLSTLEYGDATVTFWGGYEHVMTMLWMA